MQGTTSFKQLAVWQKSMEFVQIIYSICRQLPSEEKYIIASQILRASISIPSNIAEGYGRRSNKEKIQFYNIAYSSCLEAETQLEIIKRAYQNINLFNSQELIIEIQKMLKTYLLRIS